MARGDREWDALQAELRTTTPPCDGDMRFVLDSPSQRDLEQMADLCADCPLRALCHAYANTSRPPGTYWAGKHYPAPKETT